MTPARETIWDRIERVLVGVLGALVGASSSWLQAGFHSLGQVVSHLEPGSIQLPTAVAAAEEGVRTRGLRKKSGPKLVDVNKAALLGEVLSDLRRGTGALVFASASFSQAAEERKEWSNGAFTKALLEGLGSQADRNHDGKVVLSELRAYVIDRVLELTQGNQRPTVRRDFLEDDFPLY